MRDLVFVSLENWDEIWRRNQFLCSGLARRFPQARILFVGKPLPILHVLRSGRVGQLLRPTIKAVPGQPNIHVMELIKLVPNALPGGRAINEAFNRSYIRRACGKAAPEAALFVAQSARCRSHGGAHGRTGCRL
jgi:hypothetical protein